MRDPVAERREKVARIIDPYAMGDAERDIAEAHIQHIARDRALARADTILKFLQAGSEEIAAVFAAASTVIEEIRFYEPSAGEDDDELVGVALGDLRRLKASVAKADDIEALYSGAVGDGWRDIASAPRDGPVDLWGAERERYVNERITDCRWWFGRWTHPRTIYDDESLEIAPGTDYVEVYNVTHWRPLPPSPMQPGSGEEKP